MVRHTGNSEQWHDSFNSMTTKLQGLTKTALHKLLLDKKERSINITCHITTTATFNFCLIGLLFQTYHRLDTFRSEPLVIYFYVLDALPVIREHCRSAEGTWSTDANWGRSLTGPQPLLLNQLPRDGMYHRKICHLSNTSTPKSHNMCIYSCLWQSHATKLPALLHSTLSSSLSEWRLLPDRTQLSAHVHRWKEQCSLYASCSTSPQ